MMNLNLNCKSFFFLKVVKTMKINASLTKKANQTLESETCHLPAVCWQIYSPAAASLTAGKVVYLANYLWRNWQILTLLD